MAARNRVSSACIYEILLPIRPKHIAAIYPYSGKRSGESELLRPSRIAAQKAYNDYMPGLGHVARGTKYALIAHFPRPITVRDLLQWSFPGVSKPEIKHRAAVHRAVKRWAVVVGKTGPNGRANLWAANPELERQILGK
jgi:hypothetical protein